MNTKYDEKAKSGSLVEYLLNKGRLSFAIEVPDIEFITTNQMKTITNKLMEIVNNFPNIAKRKNSKIPIIERCAITTNTFGIFEPTININKNINNGDVIGNIIDINTLNPKPVLSDVDGILVFILNKTYVAPGQRVAIVGKKTKI